MALAPERSARRLALFLAGSGAMHFAVPKFYDQIIPEVLPGSARAWTLGSGVVEIATGAIVAHPRTRRFGSLAAALLFVAVFPANIKAAVDANRGPAPTPLKVGTIVRLPMQWPMITWALRVRRSS